MESLVQSDPLTLAVAALVGILGVGRATRLWIHDAWPPVVWLRDRYLGWAEQTVEREIEPQHAGGIRFPQGTRRELTWRVGWAPLATCPFCVAPWLALGSLVWLLWSGALSPHGDWTWAGAWWFTHAWFSASYVAAMLVVRDEPA